MKLTSLLHADGAWLVGLLLRLEMGLLIIRVI